MSWRCAAPSAIPYNRFSAQRPGATLYDVTLIQSLDLSGKRRANKRVAEKNITILEAHYQDAVRLEIDRLFLAYVSVLEARAMTQAARANLKHLTEAAVNCGEQVRQGRRPQSDRTRAALRQSSARIAVQHAEASLLHARRNLSVLLALPPSEANHLCLRGSLHDRAPPPPCTDELFQIARQVRPDLLALRLSIDRARAELRREKAEAVDEFFLFFSPYQALDSTPQGKLVANSWEMGMLIPIPSLNRNQGEIRRARVNVVQWRSEVERAEQEIIDEVRRAADEYAVSRQIVEQYERDILPNVRRVRDQRYRRFVEEDTDIRSFLSAQRDHNETSELTWKRWRAGLARLNQLEGTIRGLAKQGLRPQTGMDSISLERAKAQSALPRAEATLLQARRELALLLGIAAGQASLLEVAGSLHDRAPLPSCIEDLVRIALQTRPDLTAYHLGVGRAQADLRRENVESMDDIFLFYTPFNAFDFSPVGKQRVTGWGLGLLFSLPVFDLNQGEIARARVNVTQTRLALQGLERRIVNEVQYAATEYAVSRATVEQYEAEMLGDARQLRDEQARLFGNGQATLDSLLEAHREYDEIVREYLEALGYHRRTMLRLNTAVGQRILP